MTTRYLVGALLTSVFVVALVTSERVVLPEKQGKRTEVVYWEKWTGFEGDAMRATVDAFNRKQNRVFVKLLTVSGIQDKTLMAVAGGSPPDVAGLYGPNVPQYADDNAVLPLDQFCKDKGIRREQYIPVYYDSGCYRGHLYSLPTTPATTALHYNRAMFRDVGLDPAKPPQTIEEMDAMAARFLKKDDQGRIIRSGFMPAEPGWWNFGWGAIFGGKYWDGKSRITANSPENVRAFNWVQSYSRKYGVDDLQTFRSGFGNFSSPQNAFLSSRVAMEIQGVWMYNFIDQYAHNLDWSAAPFPHPADRPDLQSSTFADEDVLVIPRGAKHPREAFEFIAYVQSQEGMELLCMGQRKHTPLAAVSERFMRTHPNPYIKLFRDLAFSPNVSTPPKMGLWPEYQAELNNAFEEIILLKKSPQQALDIVQSRIQPKLDDYLRVRRLRGELQ